MTTRYAIRSRWSIRIGLLLMLLSPALQADQTLTVAWSHWPPFSQIDNRGELDGLDVSLTRQILTRAGFTPRFREIPWARALHLVEHDQLDVAMAALPLPERQQYARFSAPYRQSAYVLLSNDPIPGHQDRWAKLDTLPELCHSKGLKLGKLRGTRPIQQMEECPALKEATEYNADERMIDLLLARRLDGIIMEWQYARYRLAQLGAEGFISCQLLLHHQPVSLMFAKNSVSDAQLLKINEAIHALPKTHGKFSPPNCRLNADPGAADLLTRTISEH
ncbi:substrate-binding periplasmic protein [Aeromonas allosaccharophila]|uniref:Transporter substrate-binding domain-containing protein n=1 Tax=Aeromonas allosaccharophila TaxID=656 RepID=A0A7T2PHA6_9GAMM|nr:transporter substrate-binding domain-containing protein [Aeromonas allosaccharophila]MCE9847874.1 transporter substrate-binding domain-containing protein [Aeromonas allosaccharophila]QPR55704.1 transporter substrate-binding domain-containing protein [Aeromonas allosaccharophila]